MDGSADDDDLCGPLVATSAALWGIVAHMQAFSETDHLVAVFVVSSGPS